MPYNKTTYEAAAPALSKAIEAALRNGTAYGKLITTTPNNLDEPSGKYCYGLIEDAIPFDEIWYDWSEDKIRNEIEKNSKNDFVFLQFTYKELGYDEKWFKKQCRGLGHDLLKIKRELLLEWTLANNRSPFSEEQLAEIELNVIREPVGKFYIDNTYKFEIFSEMRNFKYKSWIIGIDVGGGLSRDFTAITIFDPTTMETKANFKSNIITIPEIEYILEKLITDYFVNCIIVPERNSLGLGLIQLMMRNTIFTGHLYYEDVELKGKKKIKDPTNRTKGSKTTTRVYGITTDQHSRKIMFDEILNMIVNDKPQIIKSPYIYNEIRTLIRTKQNKIEHAPDFHDDCLMSWLVPLYALLYGTNMKKFIKVTSDGIMNSSDLEEEENRRKSKAAFQYKFDNLIGKEQPNTVANNFYNMIKASQIADNEEIELDNISKKKKRMINILNLNK